MNILYKIGSFLGDVIKNLEAKINNKIDEKINEIKNIIDGIETNITVENGSVDAGKYISGVYANGTTITVSKESLPNMPDIPDIKVEIQGEPRVLLPEDALVTSVNEYKDNVLTITEATQTPVTVGVTDSQETRDRFISDISVNENNHHQLDIQSNLIPVINVKSTIADTTKNIGNVISDITLQDRVVTATKAPVSLTPAGEQSYVYNNDAIITGVSFNGGKIQFRESILNMGEILESAGISVGGSDVTVPDITITNSSSNPSNANVLTNISVDSNNKHKLILSKGYINPTGVDIHTNSLIENITTTTINECTKNETGYSINLTIPSSGSSNLYSKINPSDPTDETFSFYNNKDGNSKTNSVGVLLLKEIGGSLNEITIINGTTTIYSVLRDLATNFTNSPIKLELGVGESEDYISTVLARRCMPYINEFTLTNNTAIKCSRLRFRLTGHYFPYNVNTPWLSTTSSISPEQLQTYLADTNANWTGKILYIITDSSGIVRGSKTTTFSKNSSASAFEFGSFDIDFDYTIEAQNTAVLKLYAIMALDLSSYSSSNIIGADKCVGAFGINVAGGNSNPTLTIQSNQTSPYPQAVKFLVGTDATYIQYASGQNLLTPYSWLKIDTSGIYMTHVSSSGTKKTWSLTDSGVSTT